MAGILPLVHFVGSVPMDTTEEVFSRLCAELPERLQCIPDGEPAERGLFTAWQEAVFPPEILIGSHASKYPGMDHTAPKTKGPDNVNNPGTFKLSIDHLGPTRYDEAAADSYATFCRLRSARKVPPDVRFQVCLPTPLNAVAFRVRRDYVERAEKLYEHRLLEALAAIQHNIPVHDLAIQLDMAVELAHMEHAYGTKQDELEGLSPFYSPVKEGIVERVQRIAAAVSPEVPFGLHLCYGDLNHHHFVQPVDTKILVDLINAVSNGVDPNYHGLHWIHLPVPKDRTDDAYFSPLKELQIRDATLILGLVHANDHDGTIARIATANRTISKPYGIATECGLGRTPPEELGSIFQIFRSVTQQ